MLKAIVKTKFDVTPQPGWDDDEIPYYSELVLELVFGILPRETNSKFMLYVYLDGDAVGQTGGKDLSMGLFDKLVLLASAESELEWAVKNGDLKENILNLMFQRACAEMGDMRQVAEVSI